MVDESRINNTLGKMAYYLDNHESICVSVSGGSDSDIIVHMIVKHFPDKLGKIHFVFANTGLEYRATLRHLDYLEQTYNIKINRVRGMPLPLAVRTFGVPVVSKLKSKHINGFCRDVPSYTSYVLGTGQAKGSRFEFSKKEKALAQAIKERGIKVSDKCCQYSKKQPMTAFQRSVNCDLVITGVRAAEGGARRFAIKSCFEPGKKGPDKYMPLFYWDDETKAWYKDHEGIRYSDCYEVWGMTRTGCVGCPYNSRAGEDLKRVKEYEPTMYKACMNVFGTAYRLQDEFHINRKPILTGLEDGQISLEEVFK